MGAISEIISNVLLFFLVFGMSATVDIDKMRKQLKNRKALFIGVSWQFFLAPLIGFIIVKIMVRVLKVLWIISMHVLWKEKVKIIKPVKVQVQIKNIRKIATYKTPIAC